MSTPAALVHRNRAALRWASFGAACGALLLVAARPVARASARSQGSTPEPIAPPSVDPPAGAAQRDATLREAVLRRDPKTLPRAPAGAWAGWTPSSPPPDEVRAAFVAGARAYQDGDYATALAQLHDVLERSPDLPAALYQCASAYFRLRRYTDCAALAERFLEVAPAEVGATQVLGHAYYTLGEYERALEHYRRVVEAAPASVEAWRGLGLSHLRLGAAEQCLAALERALELRPEHADALVWRAQALLELGRPQEALESALRGRDLAPFEPRTWYVLGALFASLERAEDAAAARARFVELNRIEGQVRTQEGLLLNDPRAVEPRVRLVRLHAASGDKESVAENLRRLQRLLPESLEVGMLALEAFTGLGDAQAAEGVVLDLEKRFAANPAAWVAIERYWRSRGDEDRAQRAAVRRKALGAQGR